MCKFSNIFCFTASLIVCSVNAKDWSSFLEYFDNDTSSYSQQANSAKTIQKMEQAILLYREIFLKGGWQPLSLDSTIGLGDRGKAVSALAHRLSITKDTPVNLCRDKDNCEFGSELDKAVKLFQKRHGLKADGRVGAGTLNSLNVPVHIRLRQLELNLQRIKEFPGIDDEEFVYVNIPEYRLRYVQDGKVRLQNKVVVGKPSWETPSMSDVIEKFVVNPTWKIPLSITTKEIAPKAADNPNYFDEKNIEIRKDSFVDEETVDPTSIDWDEVTPFDFDYFLVEKASEENPLGEIKYLFPNKDAIYVHDTPGKHWFKHPNRAVSHGCIRMDNPFSLAEAFAQHHGIPELLETIGEVRESGETMIFHLENPVPIHLVYWTAWVDEHQRVNFRRDIYERDSNSIDTKSYAVNSQALSD